MNKLLRQLKALLDSLEIAGDWLVPLVLRLVLARAFWNVGISQLDDANGMLNIQNPIPFPFSLLPPEIGGHLVIVLQISAAIALLIGLGTRLFALGLSILTLLSIAAVQHGIGEVRDLSLLYLAMLLPLILSGPGKLSLDHWLRLRFLKTERRLWS